MISVDDIDEAVKRAIDFDSSILMKDGLLLYFNTGNPVAEVQIKINGPYIELEIFDYKRKLRK